MSGFPRTKKHEAPDDPNAGECPAPSEELAGRSAAAGAAEQEVHGNCGPRTSPGEVRGTERQNGEQKATSELCPSCSASCQPQAHTVCRGAQRCPDPLHVPSSHRCEGHLGCLQASRPAHPQQSGWCPKERLRPRPLRQRCTELGGERGQPEPSLLGGTAPPRPGAGKEQKGLRTCSHEHRRAAKDHHRHVTSPKEATLRCSDWPKRGPWEQETLTVCHRTARVKHAKTRKLGKTSFLNLSLVTSGVPKALAHNF